MKGIPLEKQDFPSKHIILSPGVDTEANAPCRVKEDENPLHALEGPWIHVIERHAFTGQDAGLGPEDSWYEGSDQLPLAATLLVQAAPFKSGRRLRIT
jgi:hypothetical protein